MLHGNLIANVFFLLLAVIVLTFSSDKAVRKIIYLINYYGFSSTFAGLTILSLVTSLPEVFAHLIASTGILTNSLDYRIASSTVLGANIGSNVIQQTFILGLVVLLTKGFIFKKKFLLIAYLPMIATNLMALALGWDGVLSRLDGVILIGTFIVYMAFLYSRERIQVKKTIEVHKLNHDKKPNLLFDSLTLLFFFTLMLASAHILLLNTQEIVFLTGLGGSLIGVVTLGVATAAPEFFTAMSGLKNKTSEITLGILIGSNITNPLLAIGLGSLLSTYFAPKPLLYWDLPMEAITAALLLVYLIFKKGKLGKGGAAYLIGLYVFYVVVRVMFFAVD